MNILKNKIKEKIILSCIVFNYNKGEFLQECLESIIHQKTEYKFNILIIDDCSTDNSREVFLYIKEKYNIDYIFFFQTLKNTGLGKKAVKQLENQTKNFLNTKYIYRIDSDDYIIDRGKFQKQISILEKNKDIVSVAHKYKLKIENKNILVSPKREVIIGLFNTTFLIRNLIANRYRTYTHISTYMTRNIKGKVLPPLFNFSFIRGEVLLHWYYQNFGKLLITDDIMTVYRIHEKGLWTSRQEIAKRRFNRLIPFFVFCILGIRYKIYFLLFGLIFIIKRLYNFSWVIIKSVLKKILY